jgi:hypothetical protein
MDNIAQFLREKAAQCRALAEGDATEAAKRGLLALALELDAQAVAIEAGHVTQLEVEAAASNT